VRWIPPGVCGRHRIALARFVLVNELMTGFLDPAPIRSA
jgi:hypothetical protein